ncbi:MAG: hypothetical protein ABSH50_09405 [Bryobacteraceae bacterium]|jgi:hypothetical protein
MRINQIKQLSFLLALASVLPSARAASSNDFHFWFQRDGGCVACARMPPPGNEGVFAQEAGIDVMFNGFDQTTGSHWGNQKVESYSVTYKYQLGGVTHTATATAPGSAASVVIKPYSTADLNTAQIVSITVAATFAGGTVTKTANSPVAFQLY